MWRGIYIYIAGSGTSKDLEPDERFKGSGGIQSCLLEGRVFCVVWESGKGAKPGSFLAPSFRPFRLSCPSLESLYSFSFPHQLQQLCWAPPWPSGNVQTWVDHSSSLLTAESLCVEGRKVGKNSCWPGTHAVPLRKPASGFPRRLKNESREQARISLPLYFTIIFKLRTCTFPLILIESRPMTFAIPKSSVNSLRLDFPSPHPNPSPFPAWEPAL